jgi:calcium-dependent protein kinase
MGCDKSKPIENYSKNLPPVELNWTRRASTNRFITKSIGSITEHYKILNVIGTTVRGTILHAEDVLSGKSRAIRQISKQSVKKPSIFFSEAAILVQLDHPNILKVFQTVETTMSYYIVFEYINGETIKKNIKKIGNEVMVSKYMRDILGALYYMHIREIAHCNLSADHILLQHNEGESVPKIIGFSDAQNLLDKRLINPKSIAYIYVSPEMLEKTFTEKTDLWSIGVIIYELLVGKLPFPSRDKNDIIKDIYNVRVDYENPNFKTLSFNAQDFIKKLLTGNPDKRISAKEALSHPWLSQTSKEYFVNYQAIQKLRTFKVIHK